MYAASTVYTDAGYILPALSSLAPDTSSVARGNVSVTDVPCSGTLEIENSPVGSFLLLPGLDFIAHTTHRFNERMREALIDLVTQVMNVDIHHIRKRFHVVAPDRINDLCA